jgi:putative membrane protein
MTRILIPAALAAVLAAQAARAQGTADSAPVNDALFAQAAAASGMGEVSVSEIGVTKATDPELKKFSQRAVADHTKLNQELMALASQKRIPLPRELDARAQFCGQSLRGESRENFDRCYAKAQLVIHMEAVAAFEAEAKRGQDPEMKALATKALPTLKEHLHMIKPIAMKYEKEHKDGPEEAGK